MEDTGTRQSIIQLPTELFLHVLGFLPAPALLAVARCNKTCQALCRELLDAGRAINEQFPSFSDFPAILALRLARRPLDGLMFQEVRLSPSTKDSLERIWTPRDAEEAKWVLRQLHPAMHDDSAEIENAWLFASALRFDPPELQAMGLSTLILTNLLFLRKLSIEDYILNGRWFSWLVDLGLYAPESDTARYQFRHLTHLNVLHNWGNGGGLSLKTLVLFPRIVILHCAAPILSGLDGSTSLPPAMAARFPRRLAWVIATGDIQGPALQILTALCPLEVLTLDCPGDHHCGAAPWAAAHLRTHGLTSAPLDQHLTVLNLELWFRSADPSGGIASRPAVVDGVSTAANAGFRAFLEKTLPTIRNLANLRELRLYLIAKGSLTVAPLSASAQISAHWLPPRIQLVRLRIFHETSGPAEHWPEVNLAAYLFTGFALAAYPLLHEFSLLSHGPHSGAFGAPRLLQRMADAVQAMGVLAGLEEERKTKADAANAVQETGGQRSEAPATQLSANAAGGTAAAEQLGERLRIGLALAAGELHVERWWGGTALRWARGGAVGG